MFNISFVSKDNVGVCQQIGVVSLPPGWNCDVRIGNLQVGKLIALPCCMTCKLLAAEWHDQHGWPYLNTAANAFHNKNFPVVAGS